MVTIMLIKLMGLMIKIKWGQLASHGPRERTQRKEETGVCDNPTPNTSGKTERVYGRIYSVLSYAVTEKIRLGTASLIDRHH